MICFCTQGSQTRVNNLAPQMAILTDFRGFAFFFEIKLYFSEKRTQ